ncbi:hypothetical protein [Roseospira goensis]|uniref:Uncharacterized protein n=1 Tax=Roseospira goensis TaxID=391922 RepID=A0A7W6WMN3_9PROT|nr:hypothetical protein [Roseospira goensis]MBB4287923.1 hypothetical protein [Roseospira goensis]
MDLRRLDWILIKAQTMSLSPREQRFIADMIDRRERYGDAVPVSDKQEDWLESIAARAA